MLRLRATAARGAARALAARRARVAVHHPESSRVTDAILGCRRPADVLALYAAEADRFGWMTAVYALKRLARLQQQQRRRPRARVGAAAAAADARLARLLALVTAALDEGSMSSTARLGHATDDLEVLGRSLEQLGLAEDSAARRAVARARAREYEDPFEADESEVQAQG